MSLKTSPNRFSDVRYAAWVWTKQRTFRSPPHAGAYLMLSTPNTLPGALTGPVRFIPVCFHEVDDAYTELVPTKHKRHYNVGAPSENRPLTKVSPLISRSY